jgi:hypothetical protein
MSDSALQHGIEECGNCQETCLATSVHCLALGGKYAEAGHIRLLVDCAEACQVVANFMLRGSDFYSSFCPPCAEVCEACARSCEALVPNDPQIRNCAESCRRCAAVCREIGVLSHEAA